MGVKNIHDEFVEKVKNICGDEYSILSEYKGSKGTVDVVHNVCGHQRTRSAKGFMESIRRKAKCQMCIGQLMDADSFKERIENKYNGEYSVLGDYVSAHVKTLIKHNVCGNEWLVSPNNIFRGYGCSKCYGIVKKDTEIFSKEVYVLAGKEYRVVGKYADSRTPIKIEHVTCGNVYKASPDNFLRGKRCPNCYHSKGESVIKDFLESHNMNFKQEFTFEDCRNIRKLRFDFAVFKNKKIFFLVEYDGIQHFKPTFGIENHKITLKNDEIKNNYCQNNNIPLLRIPYTDFENIEGILEEELNLIAAT